MKKALLFLAILFAATAINGQVFIGGSLGIDKTGGKTKLGSTTIDNPSTFTVQFSPKMGFYLNDDFALGLSLGIINISHTTPEDTYFNDQEIIDNTLALTIAAFARYKLIGNDKVALLLDGELGGGKITSKEKVGSTTEEDDPLSLFAFTITPVITYSISDRIDIEASSDFLRFGFASITETDLDDSDYKNTTNQFGIGVNAYSLNPSGQFDAPLFKVGLNFKF